MKSYEILPAGMTGGAMDGGRGVRKPKPYEILPAAGTAEQGLGVPCACDRQRVTSTIEGGYARPALSSRHAPFRPKGPLYGPSGWSIGAATDGAMVEPDIIPLLNDRCGHYLNLILQVQDRIRVRSEILLAFQRFEMELAYTPINPNPVQMPCAIFMEIHAELARSAIRAVTAGDAPTANRLGVEAREFHDEVWLMCDASDRTTMNRALLSLALEHVRRIIANVIDSISDANLELRGLRANYPSECVSFGHPIP